MTDDKREVLPDGSAGSVMYAGEKIGDLGYYQPANSLGTISIHDPSVAHPIVFYRSGNEPIVTINADGTVDVHGDTYESAKAFWDYVKQFAAAEYAKHAATHHEIRDLGEFVAERKGKE